MSLPCSPAYNKVVTGEGMPLSQDPSQRGNLILTFNIQFPVKLSPERKQLIKQALANNKIMTWCLYCSIHWHVCCFFEWGETFWSISDSLLLRSNTQQWQKWSKIKLVDQCQTSDSKSGLQGACIFVVCQHQSAFQLLVSDEHHHIPGAQSQKGRHEP